MINGVVARIEEMKNTYKIVVENIRRKTQLWKTFVKCCETS